MNGARREPRASVVPDGFVVFGAVKNEYREEGRREPAIRSKGSA